jgi:ADP-ribose pyrophosphatase YjhB (NUDIX family)
MTIPKWLEWGQKLQALARAGLSYTENKFDVERYHEITDIAAEIIATHADVDDSVIKSIYDDQVGYQTPKVDARGVVFKDDKILLVKELSDGCWTLPGGWMDVNETPGEAVAREVHEEAGYIVRPVKLMAIYDRRLHGHPPYMFHIYKLFFMCDLIGGEATTSIETGGAEFFDLNNLPPLSITRNTLEEIQRCFVHHHQPDLPTEFD